MNLFVNVEIDPRLWFVNMYGSVMKNLFFLFGGGGGAGLGLWCSQCVPIKFQKGSQ
jgi:hypothetical protein